MKSQSNSHCGCCPKLGSCIFAEVLSREQLQELHRERRIVELTKQEILFQEGDEVSGLWVVCQGRVKVFRRGADSKPLITRIAQPGEMVGYRWLFTGQAYRGNAEAMEASKLFFVRQEIIETLIRLNGKLALFFLRVLALELEQAEASATDMAYDGAEARVMTALRRLQRTRPVTDSAKRPFAIRRQDLAELAGLTVETTVRMLKKLEKDGVLALNGKHVFLKGERDSTDAHHTS